jgi:hypothetical protein
MNSSALDERGLILGYYVPHRRSESQQYETRNRVGAIILGQQNDISLI